MNTQQKFVLVIGSVVLVLLGLFPPWREKVDIPYRVHSERPLGYTFITTPPTSSRSATVQVDISRLLIEWIVVAAIMIPLFLLSRSQTYAWLPMTVGVFFFLLTISLIAWFIWPKSYTEADGVRTTRLTGTRYLWSNKKGWITEDERKADERAEAEQKRAEAEQKRAETEHMRNDLKQIRIDSWNDADYLQIYNPTHWQLPYYYTQLTVEFYNQGKLLKIAEQSVEIKPGINKIWVNDARDLLDQMPLAEKMKIRATTIQGVGSGATSMVLEPPFVFESQRICREEYITGDSGSDQNAPISSGLVNTQIVCRSN